MEKNNSIGIKAFGYKNNQKHPIYVSNTHEKNVDLLIGEQGKDTMFLLKNLILSCMIILYIMEKKHFCCYCLQACSTKEI